MRTTIFATSGETVSLGLKLQAAAGCSFFYSIEIR